jgi:hypothetical protein
LGGINFLKLEKYFFGGRKKVGRLVREILFSSSLLKLFGKKEFQSWLKDNKGKVYKI